MGIEEIRTTGLMTITKRKERVMERKRSTTVMRISTVDLMIRLIKEPKAAHSEEAIQDSPRIGGEDELIKSFESLNEID